MSVNYNNEILQTIDYLIEARTREIAFDQTIVCEIVDDTKASEGIYWVKYDGNKMKVTSMTDKEYKNGANVYLLVPKGDYTQNKVIIGEYKSSEGSPKNYAIPSEQVIKITDNLYNKSEIGNYDYGFEYEPKYLLLSATFTNKDESKDEYGLKLSATFEDNNDQIRNVIDYGILNSTNFYGNAQYADHLTQELLLALPVDAVLTSIHFEEYGSATVEDVQVYICYDKNDVPADAVAISAYTNGRNQSYNYNSANQATSLKSVDFYTKILYNQNVIEVNGNSEQLLSDNDKIIWFKYELGYETTKTGDELAWETLAGTNWAFQTAAAINGSFEATVDFDMSTTQYKVMWISKDKLYDEEGNDTENFTWITKAEDSVTFTNSARVVDYYTAAAANNSPVSLRINQDDNANFFIYGNDMTAVEKTEFIVTPYFNDNTVPTSGTINIFIPKFSSQVELVKPNVTEPVIDEDGNEKEQFEFLNYTWTILKDNTNEQFQILSYEYKNELPMLGLKCKDTNFYNTNNTIKCSIEQDKRFYWTSRTLNFGTQGTSGSNYKLNVKCIDEIAAITVFGKEEERTLTYQIILEDQDGNSLTSYLKDNLNKIKINNIGIEPFVNIGIQTIPPNDELQAYYDEASNRILFKLVLGAYFNKIFYYKDEDLKNHSIDVSPYIHKIMSHNFSIFEVVITGTALIGKNDNNNNNNQKTINLKTKFPVPFRSGVKDEYSLDGATRVVYNNSYNNPTYSEDLYNLNREKYTLIAQDFVNVSSYQEDDKYYLIHLNYGPPWHQGLYFPVLIAEPETSDRQSQTNAFNKFVVDFAFWEDKYIKVKPGYTITIRSNFRFVELKRESGSNPLPPTFENLNHSEALRKNYLVFHGYNGKIKNTIRNKEMAFQVHYKRSELEQAYLNTETSLIWNEEAKLYEAKIEYSNTHDFDIPLNFFRYQLFDTNPDPYYGLEVRSIEFEIIDQFGNNVNTIANNHYFSEYWLLNFYDKTSTKEDNKIKYADDTLRLATPDTEKEQVFGEYIEINGKPIVKGKCRLAPSETLRAASPYVNISMINENDSICYWSQPIIIETESYFTELVNSWDGASVQTDRGGGTILAQMVGAGTKDTDNKFSGVFMGKVGLADADYNGITGLYGYQKGNLRFKFDENGNAYIGSKENGKDNYIDFTDGDLSIKVNDLSIRSNDFILESGTINTNNYLYLSSSKINSNNDVFALGKVFSFNTANGIAKLAGWTVDNKQIYKPYDSYNYSNSYNGIGIGYDGINKPAFWAGYYGDTTTDGKSPLTDSNWTNWTKFYVLPTGKLCAKEAEIEGKITAEDGSIAGWNISPTSLIRKTDAPNSEGIRYGIGISLSPYSNNSGTNVLAIGNITSDSNWSTADFRVTRDGIMYAKGAYITNATITGNLNSGTIGEDWKISKSLIIDETESIKLDAKKLEIFVGFPGYSNAMSLDWSGIKWYYDKNEKPKAGLGLIIDTDAPTEYAINCNTSIWTDGDIIIKGVSVGRALGIIK